MKETKKLTMGAMLLALVGAVMAVDRLMAFYFDELTFLLFAVVIILYSTMYSLRDGGILAFGIVFLTLLFGSIFSYLYCPLGILAGLGYAYGIKKNYDRRRLLFLNMAILVVGEVILTMVVLPLFGFDFVEEVKMLYETISLALGEMGMLSLMEGFLNNIILVSFVMGIILMGVMEAILIHLVSIYLLKRFKIKEIGLTNLFDLKLSPLLAYLSFASVFLFFILDHLKENAFFLYGAITLALCGSIVLIVFGYIFCLVYGSIVLRRNISLYLFLFTFLLLPYSLILLMIVGFLYGSGPLRNLIVKKRGES